jgi:branched-chain amino acid transport system permease protein
MSTFISLLAAGISLGFIYALLALGMVVVFKSSQVVNFALGSLVVMGAFAVSELDGRIGFLPACACALLLVAIVGGLTERLLIRPARGASAISLALVTLGLDIVLVTELTRRIGVNGRSLDAPWGSASLELGSVVLPWGRVIAAVAVIVILAAFFVAMKYTVWGVAMRAVAEDPRTATLMGIRVSRVSATGWVLAGAFSVIAGVFLTTFPSAGVESTTALTALAALPAVILGGLDSPAGAVVGGLVIGVAQALTAGYIEHFSFLGNNFGAVVPYLVMFLVLVIRPTGIFGSKELSRV